MNIDAVETLPMPDEPAGLLRAKTLTLGDPVVPEVHDSCPHDSVLVEDDTDLDEASEVWEDSQPAPECEGDDWDEVRAVSEFPKGDDDFGRHHDLSPHGLALHSDTAEPDTPAGEHVPPARSEDKACNFEHQGLALFNWPKSQKHAKRNHPEEGGSFL